MKQMENVAGGKGRIMLYKQISDEISGEIDAGNLKKGMRLPSEVVMSEMKNVSVGTVKKAYGELENHGYIYKIRGGGSYVSGYVSATEENRYVTPESMVSQTVRELSKIGLQMNQIFTIIQTQSGRVFRGDQRIKAALVDTNLEVMHHVIRELEQIPCLDVELFLLNDIFSGEKVIGSQYSLVLVSKECFGELIHYGDSIHLKMEDMSLHESRETIARLAVIPDSQEICILYRSRNFLDSVQNTLKWLNKKNKLICIEERKFTKEDERFVGEKLPFIVPPDYMDYSSAWILQIIERAKKAGCILIPFEFEIDKGSLFHLKQVLEKMQIRGEGFGR